MILLVFHKDTLLSLILKTFFEENAISRLFFVTLKLTIMSHNDLNSITI